MSRPLFEDCPTSLTRSPPKSLQGTTVGLQLLNMTADGYQQRHGNPAELDAFPPRLNLQYPPHLVVASLRSIGYPQSPSIDISRSTGMLSNSVLPNGSSSSAHPTPGMWYSPASITQAVIPTPLGPSPDLLEGASSLNQQYHPDVLDSCWNSPHHPSPSSGLTFFGDPQPLSPGPGYGMELPRLDGHWGPYQQPPVSFSCRLSPTPASFPFSVERTLDDLIAEERRHEDLIAEDASFDDLLANELGTVTSDPFDGQSLPETLVFIPWTRLREVLAGLCGPEGATERTDDIPREIRVVKGNGATTVYAIGPWY